MAAPELQGCLCLVTDRGFRPRSEFLRTIELAIDHGVTMVQFREKGDKHGHGALADREAYRLGCQLRELTRDKAVLLVVDDRLDLAMAIDADGVHLGQGDLPLTVARSLWKPDRLYGLSVASVAEARVAQADGADYLGVGAIFSTSTKLDAPRTGVDLLAEIVAATPLPVIAIGGITVQNCNLLKPSACAGIAVVSAIWGAADPAAATDRLIASLSGGSASRAP